MQTESLSLHEARARALAAQGFDRKRGKVDAKALSRVIAATQLFQIDSVSVVVRAHYLPLFSRLGVYDRKLLDEAAWGSKRSLFEYWGHEASLVPFAMQPLFRWRMRRAEHGVGIWKILADFGRANQRMIADMLARIRDEGPKVAGDFEKRATKSWFWGWSNAKRGLEWLFWSGKITTATRRSFERVYDLPERVLPPQVLNASAADPHEVARWSALVRVRQRRLVTFKRDELKLVADAVQPVTITGCPVLYCLREDVAELEGLPRQGEDAPAASTTLLAPLDPLIYDRRIASSLWNFDYTWEAYTPAAKRVRGYYALPVLAGTEIIGHVDPKADRVGRTLIVVSRRIRRGHRISLALRDFARWLGLK